MVSHRGADRICIFRANGTGLELIREFASAGAGPRQVSEVQGELFVSDQLSDTVAWLAADGTVRGSVAVANPTCVLPIA